MRNLKQVLVIIYTPTFGGPHNQVLQMHQFLREAGWNQIVILPTEPGNAYERLTSAGIDVIKIPLHRLRAKLHPRWHWEFISQFVNESRAIQEIIIDKQIDIVQLCGLLTFQGALAARIENKPIVWQLLSTFAPLPLRIAATPFVVRWADTIMSTGWKVAQQHPGLMSARNRILPFFPPVDITRFEPDSHSRNQARAELGIAENEIAIGTIGNFSRQKGHDILIDVASLIQEKSKNVKFRILGTATFANQDYYNKNVRQKAETLGLLKDGFLQFMDPGQKVHHLIQGFDIFILTSRSEGIPTVMLEALSAGIPVVSTDVGSISELLITGFNGILVKSKDPAAIAKVLLTLVEDSQLRFQLGQNAHAQAQTQFSVEACVKTHIKAYTMAHNRYPRD